MTKFIVEVTSKDIREGIPRAAYACPIALAVKRVKDRKVSVFTEILLYPDERHPFWDMYELSKEASEWRIAFDRGEYVEPITFTATLMNRMGAKRHDFAQ